MITLRKLTVQNYRSIIHPCEVNLANSLTALVGKTGAGKTSLLRLMSSISPDVEYRDEILPNGSVMKIDFTNGKLKPSEILMFEMMFDLSTDLPKVVNDTFGDTKTLVVRRYFDGHYVLESDAEILEQGSQDMSNLIKEFSSASDKLKNSFAKAQARVPNLRQQLEATTKAIDAVVQSNFRKPEEVGLAIQALQNQINSIPRDQALTNEIAVQVDSMADAHTKLTQLIKDDPVLKIIKSLPNFVFLSDPEDLESRIGIDKFIKEPASSQTFKSISILGGLNPNGVAKVRYSSAQDIDSYLSTVSAQLTRKLNDMLDIGYDFKLQFVQDFLEEDIVLLAIDRQTNSTISVDEMSEGQKWWVSFFFYLSTLESSVLRTHIVLLDNPATKLHDEGKGEVQRFLARIADSGKIQIIYATHERALIDPWRTDRVLLATKNSTGTDIESVKQDKNADFLETVRRHIGSPAKYSLFGAPRSLFFEGPSDMNFVSAFNEYFEQKQDFHLNKDIYSINAMNGIDESPHYSKLLSAMVLDYLIVVDSNSNKIRDIIDKVGREVFDNNFLEIKETINREGDIEDLFDIQTYYELFKLTYDKLITEIAPLDKIVKNSQGRKLANIFGEYCGKCKISFTKNAVSLQAFKIISDEGNFSPDGLEKTKKNFKDFFSKIDSKFKNR